MSIVPFHFWSPDVYEGSPFSSTIIFSILPKIAVVYIFLKWTAIIKIYNYALIDVLFICGISSVLLGAFFSLRQKKFKRLIIFSSIAQTGFIACGLAASSVFYSGLISTFFFLIIYIITSLLVWSNLTILSDFKTKINTFKGHYFSPLYLKNLSSLFSLNKIWAFSILLIFFSLAGIPPLAGFYAKMLIIASLVEINALHGAVLLLIASTFSIFYYLKLIKLTFFENTVSQAADFSQVIFKTYLLEYICLTISFLLFCLFFIFFFPAVILNPVYFIAYTFTQL